MHLSRIFSRMRLFHPQRFGQMIWNSITVLGLGNVVTFPEISGNFRKFPEISATFYLVVYILNIFGNFRRFPEMSDKIFGNVRQNFGNVRKFSKIYIFRKLFFKKVKIVLKLLSIIPLPFLDGKHVHFIPFFLKNCYFWSIGFRKFPEISISGFPVISGNFHDFPKTEISVDFREISVKNLRSHISQPLFYTL